MFTHSAKLNLRLHKKMTVMTTTVTMTTIIKPCPRIPHLRTIFNKFRVFVLSIERSTCPFGCPSIRPIIRPSIRASERASERLLFDREVRCPVDSMLVGCLLVSQPASQPSSQVCSPGSFRCLMAESPRGVERMTTPYPERQEPPMRSQVASSN